MLLTKNNDLKLYNFGLGHMTGYGKVVFSKLIQKFLTKNEKIELEEARDDLI